MAKIGHISEFNVTDDDWDIYVERVKLFFIANAVKNDAKVAVFLTVMGNDAYKKIRALCSPAAPDTKSFDELVMIMKNSGAKPKPTEIAARFAFNNRRQQAGETISDYHLALKELAADCDFGSNLEARLRDQIVLGLNNRTIQEELLSRKDLDYETALSFALSRECASKDSSAVSASTADILTTNRIFASKKITRKQPMRKYPSNPTPQRISHDSPRSHPKCKHCGRNNHASSECYFKSAKCNSCHQQGHIKPVCPRNSRRNHRIHHVEENLDDSPDDNIEAYLNKMKVLPMHKNTAKIIQPYYVTLHVNGKPLRMEIDTGASVSVINKRDSKFLGIKQKLEPTDIILKTYTEEIVVPIGKCTVEVSHKSSSASVEVYVVDDPKCSPLMGRTWLQVINLDWQEIRSLSTSSQAELLENKYSKLFEDNLGKMKNFQAEIQLKPDTQPKFLKSRPVPVALREKVNADIERLVTDGVLEPVKTSEWATPIVPVVKGDGSVRICGDFKVTINPALCVETYPQPRREDLFAELAGGQSFTKLDLAQAYLQMEVKPSSRKFLTINTQKGLFQYNRLVFGIASAPAIFQRAIETILQGIPGTLVYQDDILITGKSQASHEESLHQVLSRLQEHNLRLKINKCKFFAPSITYLGHKIDSSGISTVEEKVQGILETPKPSNVSELRSFLGTVNYYGNFISNLSNRLAPLNNLLKTDVNWCWSQKCDDAFNDVKQCLCQSPVLAHYDPNEQLMVACDASPHGIAAVLSHRYENGTERPVAYASRTLTESEKRYAQIDREALALVFGVKKFKEYLFGKPFILVTDNRPLTHILCPNKSLSTVAASRIQRWAVFLGSFNYSIEHRSAANHENVDGLSRLPAQRAPAERMLEADMFTVKQINTLPVTSDAISRETKKDPLLSRVLMNTMNGWTEKEPNEDNPDDIAMKPFFNRRPELSLYNGVIMWGTRVVIPRKFQAQILDEIHAGHTGIVKMKSIARNYVYWPNIDKDIEKKAHSCNGCHQTRKMPTSAQLHPWEWPSKPWQRLHIDFAGPFLNKMFLIVVDAHSKWPEVIPMATATTLTTIEALRPIFARFGVPQQIVSDNGSQFTSSDFSSFLSENGVRHIRIAPFHPSSNGLAERFVQSFKQAMKSAKATEKTINKQLSAFLLAYRNSNHSTTAASPATLLLGKQLRTRLDLVRPSTESRVINEQAHQVLTRSGRNIEFDEGEKVLVRNYRPHSDKWLEATIKDRKGPLSYTVEDPNKNELRRHCDQIVKRTSEEVVEETEEETGEEEAVEEAAVKIKRQSRRPVRLIEEK